MMRELKDEPLLKDMAEDVTVVFRPTAASDCYPNFPLEITLSLSEQSGLIFGNLSISEARAVDAMVRRAMLVGWDACNTAAKHGPDNVIEKRADLERGLFE